MSPDKSTDPIRRFLEAERRFHERTPIKAVYSKLFLRTVAWFLFFWLVYLLVTSVV